MEGNDLPSEARVMQRAFQDIVQLRWIDEYMLVFRSNFLSHRLFNLCGCVSNSGLVRHIRSSGLRDVRGGCCESIRSQL
jgi:hypothetical protein